MCFHQVEILLSLYGSAVLGLDQQSVLKAVPRPTCLVDDD